MNFGSARIWFRVLLIALALGLLGLQLLKTGSLPDWRILLAAGAAILYAIFRFRPKSGMSPAEKAEDYGFHLDGGENEDNSATR